MARLQPWRNPWMLGTCGILITAVGYGTGQHLGGLNFESKPAGVSGLFSHSDVGAAVASPTLTPDAKQLPITQETIILAQRKRVMGRMASLEHVSRVATQIRPLVDAALEQPQVQKDLRALAKAAGMSVKDYKKYFAAKQEADLLLESGGDPEARSVADAIGVAQFLAGTGRRCGLRINTAASASLSREIAALNRQIEQLAALPSDWTRPVPPELASVIPSVPDAELPRVASTDASALPAPSAPATPSGVWSRDQWIAYRKSQRERLASRRRQVDERYDPAKAIAAQTRYLAKLTRRYGGVDWALQAYHGGEGGAERTMRLFAEAGNRRTAPKNHSVPDVGNWLPYSQYYQKLSPSSAPASFSYIFGRSDDHRYYWWKVLMAERALDLYRKDPKEFEQQWKELQPGYSSDAVYYPEPEKLQFADNAALREGYRAGALTPLPSNAAALGIRTAHLAKLAPDNTGLHKGLRPEAMGALMRLASIYRDHGGQTPLTALTLVESNAYRELWKQRYPDPPLPPGVPRDPEYHSTGMVFDLQVPASERERKILEYSLGQLYDCLRISWRKEREGGVQRYHVTVNPEFRNEFIAYHKAKAR